MTSPWRRNVSWNYNVGLQLQDPVRTARSKYTIHRASVALLPERIIATLRQSLQSTLNQQDFSKIQ